MINMKNGRYAVISQVRLQVGAFTNNFAAINPAFNYIVDLYDHPQADEVQEDWFYDPVTGVFSKEGEISYPEIELVQEDTELYELYRAVNLLNQAEIIANQRQQDKVMAAILLEQVGGEVNV